MVTNNQNQAKATADTNTSKPVVNTQDTAKVVDTSTSAANTTAQSASTQASTTSQATQASQTNTASTQASSTDAGAQYKANDQAWNNYDASKANYAANQASTQASAATNNAKSAREATAPAAVQATTVSAQKTARDGGQANGIDVTVPHQDLDNAVNTAKQTGVQVKQDPTQQKQTDAAGSNQAQQDIKKDYQDQTNKLNQATEQQKVVNSNNSHIGSEGDHSALDQAVSDAKSKGINVVKDDDQNMGSDVDASKWQDVNNQINSDYQNQVNALNKASSDYQAAMDQYNKDEAKYQQDEATYEKEKNASISACYSYGDNSADTANVSVEILNGKGTLTRTDRKDFTGTDAEWEDKATYKYTYTVPSGNYSGNVLRATYTDLSPNFKIGDKHVNKIVATFSDLQDPGFSGANSTEGLTVYDDPMFGFWYWNSQGVHVDFQFYVDGSDQLFSFDPSSSIFGVTSLDHYAANGHTETVTLTTDGQPDPISNSDVQYNGNTATPVKPNFDNNNQPINPDGSSDANSDWLWGNHSARYFVGGSTIGLTYKTVNNDASNPSTLVPIFSDKLMINPPTPPTPPTKPTVHYHYDKMAMKPQAAVQADYHYDDLKVTPTDTKHVEAGSVTGDNGTSVDGKEVVKDEQVTFPLISSSLPANRTDDAKSLVITDTLDKNVKFDGWKAVDANGNDVSKDFTLKQDGQNLTFTATDDFVKSMNADKSKEFAIPTIDIYATATASGVKVNNQYKFTYNGQIWDSNIVNVTTPPTPTTDKHAHDANGGVIDQTFVKQGQPVNYTVAWDLTGDKNVVLTKDMIAKGLGIQDTIDNRLQVNMDGVKVTDGSGKEVSKDLLNITNDNGTVKVMAKDPQAFLNQYQGQKLTVSIPTTVKQDITGNIPNRATEIHFGDNPQTNEVVVYVPNPQKDVEAGTVTGSNVKQSVNGKEVVKGEAITFPLTTSDLPAGRNEDIKSYVITDKLDPNFDYSSVKAFLDGKDITNEFTVKNDNGTLTLTANADLLKAMNADKSKAFKCPVIDIYGTAKNSGVEIKNQYTESIDNKPYNSNTVEVKTPGSPQPDKKVDDAQGNDIDAHFVTQGQPVNFTVGFDLTKDKDVLLDPTVIAKGLDIEDTIDSRLTVNTDGIKITDAKGQVVDKSLFDITNNNNTVTVKVKDPQAFLNKYQGQMLSVLIPTTTKKDVTGDIYNTAIENHFGDKQKTNQVVVYIPAPHKDVEAGIVQGTSSTSINGKDVVKGQSITFPLTTSALPAGRKEDIKSYVIKDTLDSNFKYDSFQAFKAGQDVTSDFVPSLTQGEDGKWTLTLTATQSLLDQMNADKSKAFDIPVIDLYGSANASGITIKNDYQEILNGKDYTSNTVTVNTTPEEKPSKEVTNDDNQDIDNTNVEDGDMLNYKVTMDLTGLKNVTLTPDTIAKGLSIIDTLPDGVTLQQGAITVTTADGKTDLTNMFSVAVNGRQVTVAAKDPARLVREYGDQKLIVKLPTKVNDGFTGDLTNIAEQNTFGNIDKTNQVVNHVPAINPKKDVCIDLGNQNSLNGKDIKVGQIFDYTLGVQRPANYGGVTKQWSVIDRLSDKDEFTGQFQVMSTCPITLEDGTVLPTDSDISRYFNMSYDYANHTVTIAATPEFLKICNLPANKKEAFGWKAFVQCKRVGYGDVTNVFEESYNGVIKKSNMVITHTPKPAEPKKPEAKPATPAPAPAKPAPAKPVAPQPAPAKPAPASPALAKPAPKPVAQPAPAPQPEKPAPAPKVETPAPELPQTGEKENGIGLGIAEAAAGVIALSALKRKKKDED